MKEVLVVANRTLGGAKLLEAVRARAADGDVRFRLVVPQSKPSAGLVIYDEAVRESAQVRVDLALSLVAGEGIDATGEVGDPDPFLATMDAIADAPAGRDHHLDLSRRSAPAGCGAIWSSASATPRGCRSSTSSSTSSRRACRSR